MADSPDSPSIGHALYPSRSSPSSEAASPMTPSFTARSHTRFPSLGTSPSPTSSPTMRESFDGFGASKRPLTEVKEEPQERDEDCEVEYIRLARAKNCKYIAVCNAFLKGRMIHLRHPILIGLTTAYNQSPQDSRANTDGHLQTSLFPAEYDLADNVPGDDVFFRLDAGSKRHCAEENTISGMSSRLGSRFPSFSQRWKLRRAGSATSIADSIHETVMSRSRANSTRAPSSIDSVHDSSERGDHHLPPTPARSTFEEARDEPPVSPIDVQKANSLPSEEDDVAQELATTPLLPPMMIQCTSNHLDEPIQSPLQSPTIAESSSAVHTPIDGPRFFGLPSPPLSTRPSVSSFHHRQLAPSSEIPQIDLADNHDTWADKLGHANFIIYPEAYLPTVFDHSTYKQLRADWDTARVNFMKHLSRTGEHYSTTSKIYQLTEEKWAEIDAQWKHNYEAIASSLPEFKIECSSLSKQKSMAEPVPLMKIPSLNGPRSEGKFPKLGDEGIVGPMVREKSQLKPPKRKRTFWKFLQGVLPTSVAFGRGQT